METLFAVAVVVATLKAHAAPPVESPAIAVVERHEVKAAKPKTRAKPEPSIGF